MNFEPQPDPALDTVHPPTLQVEEIVTARVPDGTAASGSSLSVAVVTPTQVRRPWRSTVRTIVQLVLAFATLAPFVAAGIYEDLDQAPVVVAQILGAAATFTRVMALPQVEAFLRRWAPWLAAAPAPRSEG